MGSGLLWSPFVVLGGLTVPHTPASGFLSHIELAWPQDLCSGCPAAPTPCLCPQVPQWPLVEGLVLTRRLPERPLQPPDWLAVPWSLRL